ncbi:MAG: RusA family crossover junction endodeoxyribonuclease [Oscillospiraceae bacterium]|nr:RusA family crossover junction endodeoxyribonuclease [Oscillospiraceae bacterium]
MFNLQFFMPMIPPTTTFQAKELAVVKGRAVLHDSQQLIAVKTKLRGHLYKYVPAEPIDGPVRIMVKWCYPVTGKHQDGEWKITKPDTDNLQKALLDSMTKLGFWKDDAQVASQVVEKFWSSVPGIFVYITQLEGGSA